MQNNNQMKQFFQECNSYEGRWNRKRFWLYPLGVSLITLLPIGIILAIFADSSMVSMTFGPLLVIAYIYISYIQVSAYIKRLHDLDKNGWLTLLAFVPIANIYVFILCGFFKGTPWDNKYGANPLAVEHNTTET